SSLMYPRVRFTPGGMEADSELRERRPPLLISAHLCCKPGGVNLSADILRKAFTLKLEGSMAVNVSLSRGETRLLLSNVRIGSAEAALVNNRSNSNNKYVGARYIIFPSRAGKSFSVLNAIHEPCQHCSFSGKSESP